MAEMITIDLTNYKDRVGSRVAPGRYRVVVDDAELTESRSSKNPMVNLWFRIQGGEYDNQTVTDRVVITENSMFRVVGFLNAINIPTPRQRLRLDVDRFKNRVLEIDVEDGEPYNGRVRSEVRAYYKAAPGANPLNQDSDEFGGLGEFQAESSSNPVTDDAASDLPDPTPAPADEATTALGNPEPAESTPQKVSRPNPFDSVPNPMDDDGQVNLDDIQL